MLRPTASRPEVMTRTEFEEIWDGRLILHWIAKRRQSDTPHAGSTATVDATTGALVRARDPVPVNAVSAAPRHL